MSGRDSHRIALTVNGEPRTAEVPGRLLLADFLRHRLDLKGTHIGCEHGVCGACTVLANGESMRSCNVFAVQMDGAEIVTIEGLGANRVATALRTALHECHGLQCGYCTPGILSSMTEFLTATPDPSRDAICAALDGNLCRCTGYLNIVEAVLKAAAALRGPSMP